jgi:hypothetical protein
VYTKGSEVGYSLQTIEKNLALKPELKQTFLKQKEPQEIQDAKEQIKTEKQKSLLPKSIKEKKGSSINRTKEIKLETKEEKHHAEQFNLLEQLTKPEQNNEGINSQLLKKKKRRRHLHL